MWGILHLPARWSCPLRGRPAVRRRLFALFRRRCRTGVTALGGFRKKTFSYNVPFMF
jgi:hypothetical protein